jgi:hypothetical protein
MKAYLISFGSDEMEMPNCFSYSVTCPVNNYPIDFEKSVCAASDSSDSKKYVVQ